VLVPLPFAFHTPTLVAIQPDYYKPTENRVSIFTRYPCVQQHPTYDPYTALCVELETERGLLLVYGTIMGIYGNRHENFRRDLPRQAEDVKRLSEGGANICVVGDYNLSFSDNYCFTKDGRTKVLDCFSQVGVTILTSERTWCIDHIAVSDRFVSGAEIRIEEWNLEKSLSDHKGILAELTWR
jgi:endonuclease/exonuclease/phosphatase family metal-dependent hydrolase